jgi:hypothetical protein
MTWALFGRALPLLMTALLMCGAAAATATPPALAVAQAAPEAQRAPPSRHERDRTLERTWDRTKVITREQWLKAKRQWSRQTVIWRRCIRQAEDRRLKGSRG